jgi:general stress protein 26
MDFRRRDVIIGVPGAGLASILATGAANGTVTQSEPDDLYRVDDPVTIMAAAREIMQADWVGVLITIDGNGMPRARPVGVGDPSEDGSLWMSTRRGSRKTQQIAANPNAALHFGIDDLSNGHRGSCYASFLGTASVHTDAETIETFGPPPEYRAQWPQYPDDLAVIRFRPRRLEVMGKGISASAEHWQPQGITLPREA